MIWHPAEGELVEVFAGVPSKNGLHMRWVRATFVSFGPSGRHYRARRHDTGHVVSLPVYTRYGNLRPASAIDLLAELVDS